jgi:uncharacterized protein YndB with AHSA1/START domain
MTTATKQTITAEHQLPHPPAKVWRALTEPALLAAWLMDNDIRAEVGHRFTFKTKPMGDWDGTVQCEVLAVDPPHLLRYSWRGGELDTVITFTLTPTPSGTLLRLEHEGFELPRDAFAFDAMGKGWRGKVGERLSVALGTSTS